MSAVLRAHGPRSGRRRHRARRQLPTLDPIRPARAAAALAALPPVALIWALAALLSASSVALLAGFVARSPAAALGAGGFALLAVGFAATEVLAVHLHFRRGAQSFTLTEIPLVLGLFLASPLQLVGAHLLGSLAALLVHSRQRPVKLVFNLASFLAADTLAVGLFRLAAGPAHALDLRAWAAAIGACAAAVFFGVVLVWVALSLSERSWRRDRLAGTLQFGMIGSVVGASLGVMAMIVLEVRPAALSLLLVPMVGAYLAHAAYAAQRRRHESLQFLFDSTRLLARRDSFEGALVDLLSRAREAFRAEFAAISYLPADASAALRSIVGRDEALEVLHRSQTDIDDLISAYFAERTGPLRFDLASGDADLVRYLDEHGLRDALVAPLRGETRVLGILALGNRVSDLTGFDDDDAQLLDTLTRSVSVALENGHLEQSLAALRILEEQLTYQAHHDPLTNLANRTLFRQRVGEALDPREGRGAAAMLVDLDDFKHVNDSLGHAAGDELLVAVAARLQCCVRPQDLVARLGGDEFAILLDAVTDEDEAKAVAHRVLDALAEPVSVEGRLMPVYASLGVAVAAVGDEAAGLLRNADVAMYAAKAKGKRCAELFVPAMHIAALERYDLTCELERALRNHELVVHFQPVIDLASGRLVGAEALVRWRHPRLGLLLPGSFVPLAEETGAVVAIGRIVLAGALRHAQALARHGLDLFVSVNLSVRDLQEPDLLSEVARLLADHDVAPSALMFEITERLMADELAAVMGPLGQLSARGVRLALDDFGEGNASLSYLRDLPVDTLKIAKPFVDDLGSGKRSVAFAQAIVKLGHELGLSVVAEGAERAEQVDLLRRMGCDEVQGHYFARALDPEAFLRWSLARTPVPTS